MSKILLGCPTYDGKLDYRVAGRMYAQNSQKHEVFIQISQSSLLAQGCNNLWCTALNERKNFTWFAMLHGDVIPEPYWLDKMIRLAEDFDTDFLSAAVAIKDARGLVSTAIDFDIHNQILRLTKKQISHPDFPVIFDNVTAINALKNLPPGLSVEIKPGRDKLLVNTGCCLMRIDKPWDVSCFFTIKDYLYAKGNTIHNAVDPEDWFFSRRAAENGKTVMATTLIETKHIGGITFSTKPKDFDDGFNIDPDFQL